MKLSRLRHGELIAALSAIVLVALLFLVTWFHFGSGPATTAANGWHSLPVLRWFLLVTAAGGLLLAYLQAAREAPALPAAVSMILMTLAAISTVLLVIRLPTSDGRPQIGAYLGLAATIAVGAGAFRSLRQEGGWLPDGDHPIERITITPSSGPDR